MKKFLGLLLAFVMLFSPVSNVFADSGITLNCDLTCEGQNLVFKQTDDIITVTYTLKNVTDETGKYVVSSHTNEVYYDPDFFEYVEDSASITAGISQTAKYQEWSWGARSISFNGYAQNKKWASKQIVGTFQLKVIATEGSSTIYSVPVIASTNGIYNFTTSDLTVKIGEDISYVVEVNFSEDYIDGKKIILVYTNNDGISFDYDGVTMYDVTSKGYEYIGDEDFIQTSDTKVYAIVVDAVENATLDDYKANVAVIYEQISADKVISLPTSGLECDLNKSGDIDIGDPISAYGVFHGDSELYPLHMELILETDVNNDKCINEEDTDCFEKAYIDTKNKS